MLILAYYKKAQFLFKPCANVMIILFSLLFFLLKWLIRIPLIHYFDPEKQRHHGSNTNATNSFFLQIILFCNKFHYYVFILAYYNKKQFMYRFCHYFSSRKIPLEESSDGRTREVITTISSPLFTTWMSQHIFFHEFYAQGNTFSQSSFILRNI